MDRLKGPALKELVERLEARHISHHGDGYEPPLINPDGPAAAQAIRQLCAENEGLREALDEIAWQAVGVEPHKAPGALHWIDGRVARALSQPKEPR